MNNFFTLQKLEKFSHILKHDYFFTILKFVNSYFYITLIIQFPVKLSFSGLHKIQGFKILNKISCMSNLYLVVRLSILAIIITSMNSKKR